MRKSLNRGIQILLVIFAISALMGCQSQKQLRAQMGLLQQNMDSNAEKMASLIERLEENQQTMNEDIKHLQAAQHKILSQMIPEQRESVDQVAETIRLTREDLTAMQQEIASNTENTVTMLQGLEDRQQAALESASTQLTQQVNGIGQRQQRLEAMTGTVRKNGLTLQEGYDHCLARLTDLQVAYRASQEQLDRMRERIVALDTNVTASLSALGQFEDALKENQAAQNEKIQIAEQGLQEKLTELGRTLAQVGEAQKKIVALSLVRDVDKPRKKPSRPPVEEPDVSTSGTEAIISRPQRLRESRMASPAPPL